MGFDLLGIGSILSGIGGLLGVGSGAMNAVLQHKENEANRAWQHEEAQIARDWQEKMWNASNDFNSPAQQMQRLTDANLNPNLVYSTNPNMAAGTLSTSAPSSSQVAPQVDMSGLFDAIRAFESFARLDSDVQTAASQRETMSVQREALHQDVLNKVSENCRIIAQTKYLDQQTKGQIISNNIAAATQSSQILAIRNNAEAAHWQAEISHMSYKERKYNVEVTLPLQTLSMQIQQTAANAGISVSYAEAAKLAADTQNALVNGKILSMEYEWQDFLKSKGLDPRLSPAATTVYRVGSKLGLWNDIIAPVVSTVRSNPQPIKQSDFNVVPTQGGKPYRPSLRKQFGRVQTGSAGKKFNANQFR